MVSELGTNAVIHAGTEVTVRIERGAQTLRLEVGDRSRRLLSPRRYADTAGTGRGLLLVDTSADQWGVEPTSDGKTVWVEFGCASAPVDLGVELATTEPAVLVALRNLPLLMHWAWQEHAQALLREYLLFRLDEDPSALDQHAQAGEASAILHEQVPRPLLPDDPDALLAGSLDPDMTAEEVVISIPTDAVARFATLDLVLGLAIEAASRGLFLGPPTQPEIEELREWLCDEMARQAAGG